MTATTKTKARRVAPGELVPSVEKIERATGSLKTTTYHVGIIPGLNPTTGERVEQPVETVTVNGQRKVQVKPGFRKCPQHAENFGPVTFAETYTPHAAPNAAGEATRTKHFGRLVDLTADEVKRCVENISRSVVRWRARDGKHAHGYKVVIPTEEDLKNYAAKGRSSPYTPHPNDEPYANWLYMVKADSYSPTIPEPLSKTGLELPDE